MKKTTGKNNTNTLNNWTICWFPSLDLCIISKSFVVCLVFLLFSTLHVLCLFFFIFLERLQLFVDDWNETKCGIDSREVVVQIHIYIYIPHIIMRSWLDRWPTLQRWGHNHPLIVVPNMNNINMTEYSTRTWRWNYSFLRLVDICCQFPKSNSLMLMAGFVANSWSPEGYYWTYSFVMGMTYLAILWLCPCSPARVPFFKIFGFGFFYSLIMMALLMVSPSKSDERMFQGPFWSTS